MPVYLYKARDEMGKLVTGRMEASSQADVADKLGKMGYLVISVSALGLQLKGLDLEDKFARIKAEDMVMFNIQLANMINSGLALLTSLRTLGKQIENKRLRDVVGEVYRDVEAGNAFSSSINRHPQIFSPLFVSMVKAGEASGKLGLVLGRLATFIENDANLRATIKGALTYPIFLVFASIAVVLALVTFVIPSFVEIFTKAGVNLPLPTQLIFALGQGIRGYWYLLILGIGLLIFCFRLYAKSAIGRWQLDSFKLKTPIVGALFRRVYISRFARTLSTLLASGVPILESLRISEDVVGNVVISKVLRGARDAVKEGTRLAEPLRVSGEFPADIVQMVAAGEETGNLDGMLSKVADFYDTTVSYSVKRLTTFIEPVFLMIIAAIVGVIMASVLLPLFDMVKLIRR